MTEKNDGGTAFPAWGRNEKGELDAVAHLYKGMSLRDWLAGQAIPYASQVAPNNCDATLIGKWAYEIADAMLKEREK